jgi:RNA polymerase sigma-70 factor (ECF subfamily)
MAEVLSALSGLRIEDQEIIALCDWAGLTYAETATVLGVPIGTVASRLSRAHDRIRTSLNIPSANTCPTEILPSPRILE